MSQNYITSGSLKPDNTTKYVVIRNDHIDKNNLIQKSVGLIKLFTKKQYETIKEGGCVDGFELKGGDIVLTISQVWVIHEIRRLATLTVGESFSVSEKVAEHD